MLVSCAEEHPYVKEHLGVPLKGSYFWSGNADDTRAVVTIPVTGTKGSGVIEGRAVLQENGWRVLLLQCVFPPSSQRISIIDPTRVAFEGGYGGSLGAVPASQAEGSSLHNQPTGGDGTQATQATQAQ